VHGVRLECRTMGVRESDCSHEELDVGVPCLILIQEQPDAQSRIPVDVVDEDLRILVGGEAEQDALKHLLAGRLSNEPQAARMVIEGVLAVDRVDLRSLDIPIQGDRIDRELLERNDIALLEDDLHCGSWFG